MIGQALITQPTYCLTLWLFNGSVRNFAPLGAAMRLT